MITDFKVSIYNRLPSTKVDGITVPGGLTFIKEIEVDIQPYSTELLIKQYGYNIEVNKRIFINTDSDNDVKIGTVFYYQNPQGDIEKYEVKKIIPWDDYLDIACLKVN